MEWILAILIAIIAIILYKFKSDSKKFENLLSEQKEEIKNLRSQNLKLEEELKKFIIFICAKISMSFFVKILF